MQETREIYWNIGHWVIIPLYTLVVVVFGIVLWGFYRRYRVWRIGKPLARRDHFGVRTSYFLRTTFTQQRVLRVLTAGLPHALFFWGLAVLFLGSLLIMLQTDLLSPAFHFVFLKGSTYQLFSLATDLAGLAAIVGLVALAVRRFIVRPKGLVTIVDDYLVYSLLFGSLIGGFMLEAARMAATELPNNPALAHWSPVGLMLARALGGISVPGLESLHRILWWVHLGSVFAIIAIIPFTKLRHVFTTPLNYLFRSHEEKGASASLDLESDTTEQFGAAKVVDLSWKDIYDSDACTSCKRCQDRCPAWQTEKPLSPMTLVQEIGRVAFTDPTNGLVEAVSTDAIWACTTCRACQEICPAEIEHVNKVIELRRNLVLMEGSFPDDGVESAARSVEMSGNPFGVGNAGRGHWAEDNDVPIIADGGPMDVLYFAGCYASFDPRNQKVASAFTKVCRAAGVRVGVLGKAEKCCGEPMRKLGNEYLYQMLAEENIAAISGSGAEKVVVTCPHCFNTLTRDYRELGLQVVVEHHTTFIDGLIRTGRLPLAPGKFSCTYHDSCYMGRYMDIYAEPRHVLAAVGANVTEMRKHAGESYCCGGGGGRVLADERLGTRISASRIEQAQETQAPLLVSNCPFCLAMFEDAIGEIESRETLRVQDLAEVVAERLVPNLDQVKTLDESKIVGVS